MWCDESWMFLTDVLHTATTTPSIPRWLTMFIDLVIYLSVLNGSWTVSNAFSLSVKMAGGFRPSLHQYAVSRNWSCVGPILQSWERSRTALCKMFLDLVCRCCVEGVCIAIHDRYGSVAFWWWQVWLWYWGNTVLIGWIRKCFLLPPVYSGTICEGWVLFLL